MARTETIPNERTPQNSIVEAVPNLPASLQDIITLDAWVTSDNHWEHPRIREYQNRPENHFYLMREKWQEKVGGDDVILHLGDIVCFGDRRMHEHWVSGLPGRKYLIKGNHDYHSNQWYEAAGFTILPRSFGWRAPDGRMIAFSHAPLEESNWWHVNVHGHVHGNTHREVPAEGDYRNVSVEVTEYAPVRLGKVLA